MDEDNTNTTTNTSSGWGWGSIPTWDSIVDTVKKQSDVVANVLERDISEFISVVAPSGDSHSDNRNTFEAVYDPDTGIILNAQGEAAESAEGTKDIDPLLPTDAATGAATHDVVHETVAKIEALVDRAEDFLEHVDVGNTVHKIVESVNASETVHKIEELADTAEDFLESVETGVWNFMSSAISTSMGVLGGGTGTKTAVVPKANIIFDRKTATILALRRDATTYTVDPSALLESSSISDKELAERFKSFKGSFEISTYATQITRLLDEDSEVRAVLSKTVPSAIPYDEFWTRYFFRVQEVDREEEARKKLMSDANLNDEEFAWDDDSEEEEKQQLPPQQSEKHIVQTTSESRTDATTPTKESVQKQQLKEDSKILGPVSISEAVAVVERNKATPTGQRHHPVVEELRENSSGSDSSSFDVVSDKPKGGVESLADSEIASVNSTDEEAAKGDKKEKEKVLGKEDEEEGEAADWDTWE